jgi:hypothetical protein
MGLILCLPALLALNILIEVEFTSLSLCPLAIGVIHSFDSVLHRIVLAL